MLLDIGFALALAICVLIGIKQGFVKAAFGIISLFASILASIYLYKPFIDMLYGIPFVSGIIDSMIESTEKAVLSIIETNGMASIPPFLGTVISGDITAQGTGMIAHAIAEAILSCVLIIVFIILIRIGISLIAKTLDLFTKLPVIKHFNGLLGGISGLVSGILVCYIAAIVLFIISNSAGGGWVTESLGSSVFAKRFFETNILISSMFSN